jgi:membrane associated rhomboid family serine protease
MFPLQDTIPSRGVPLVTWTIILINALAFFYELSLPPDELQRFIFLIGFVPARFAVDPAGAFSTLITCMFLHGGWAHFIGNMWMLYLFGDNVEERMGAVRYLIFYLLCGVGAGLAHYFMNPTSELPSLGASGAIAGVLGAYFRLFPTARVITLVLLVFLPLFIEIPAVVFIGIWFISQLFSGTIALLGPQYAAGVAWWAHVGGFLAGVVLVPLFTRPETERLPYYADEYRPW